MELLSILLGALLGSAGLYGIVQSAQALSTRRRLDAAIEGNLKVLSKTVDEHAQMALQQAVTTDSLKLAALSLHRAAPSAGGWIVPVIYLVALAAGLVIFLLALTNWHPEMFLQLVPLIVALLYVALLVPYMFLMAGAKRRRRQYITAVTALAKTNPAQDTDDVRAGRAFLSRRRRRALWRKQQRVSATADQWASLRRAAVRRRRWRRSALYMALWS